MAVCKEAMDANDDTEEFLTAIQAGLADINAGRTRSLEDIT